MSRNMLYTQKSKDGTIKIDKGHHRIQVIKGGDTVEIDKIDWKGFFVDAEKVCFDCGSAGIILVVISQGVALCASCLKIIEEDYPKKTEL